MPSTTTAREGRATSRRRHHWESGTYVLKGKVKDYIVSDAMNMR